MHGNISRASSSSSISSASTDFHVATPPSSTRTPSRADLTSALSSATRSLTAAIASAHQAQAEIDHITRLLSALPALPHPPDSPTRRLQPPHVARLSTPSPEPRPSLPVSSSRPLLHNGSIRRGDRVRIRNPRDFQQPKGFAIGVNGQFILVQTPNGDIVRRIERNLILLQHSP